MFVYSTKYCMITIYRLSVEFWSIKFQSIISFFNVIDSKTKQGSHWERDYRYFSNWNKSWIYDVYNLKIDYVEVYIYC